MRLQGYAGAYVWAAAVLYSFQIYADFSGGMDIVLGMSEIFGVRMTENFRRPMLAGSVAEFWQRWHITLGSWMRDYLFYPLALSKPFGRLGRRLRGRFGPYVAKVAPAVLASFIVFTCVGVWHGAEWKYVVYGFYQALFVSTATLLEPLYARMRKGLHVREKSAGFQAFRVLRTFLVIMVGPRALAGGVAWGCAGHAGRGRERVEPAGPLGRQLPGLRRDGGGMGGPGGGRGGMDGRWTRSTSAASWSGSGWRRARSRFAGRPISWAR